MKRNIFKTVIVTLFILLCPMTVKADINREVPSRECAPNLPEHLYGLLEQENCKIYETNGVREFFSGIGAFDGKDIYIQEGCFDIAAYHEIGHFYDNYLGGTSDTDEFTEIFITEKESCVQNLNYTAHRVESSREYFAESFKQFYINSAKLQTYAPRTYAFIDKKINDPICRRKDTTSTEVGEETTVDISEYLPYVTNVTYDTSEDSHVFLYVSGTDVYIKGISKGKTLYTLYGPNNTYMTVRCEVPGKPAKQKKYNDITDVISNVSGYKNFCIAKPYSNEFLILAQSVGSAKLKITFYDYNKKKVGSCKLTNEAKPDDPYAFVFSLNPSNLKISQKKFNTIAYYRIGVSK